MSQKVHILMPAYNAEPFIEKSLRSITAQDHDNFHLFVLNDASTDQTVEKAKAFIQNDARFTVIHNETNLGIALSRSRLIDLSKAADEDANTLWLDADDQYTDSTFIRQFAKKMHETKADVCLFGFSVAFENESQDLRDNATGLMKDRENLAIILDKVSAKGITSMEETPEIASFTSLGWTKGYGPDVQLPTPANGAFEDFVYMAVLYTAERITAFPGDYQPVEYLRRSTSTTGKRTLETFDEVLKQLAIFKEYVAGVTGQKHELADAFVARKINQYGTLLDTLIEKGSISESTREIYHKGSTRLLQEPEI